MFQGIYKSAIKMPDTNTNYIFGTGSLPINIKTAQLATFADGTTKQQGYQVAEVNKLISTMLTGWDANGNKPKSMSDNYLELILSCDNGFVVKKRLQFPHIIAWQDDNTPYNIADVYKEFSIDNWLKADDFENPDITLVVEPTDEILTTSTATPPEATTEQSGRFYIYYRNLPVGVNRVHIDFHIKTKTEPIDFDLEVMDGLSWKDAQIILASNDQAKINVLLSSVKDVYKFTGTEGDFENITMYQWSDLYQQIISLNSNNKFTHDLYFYLYIVEDNSIYGAEIKYTPSIVDGLMVAPTIANANTSRLMYIPCKYGETYTIYVKIKSNYTRWGFTQEIPSSGMAVTNYNAGGVGTTKIILDAPYDGYLVCSAILNELTGIRFVSELKGVGKEAYIADIENFNNHIQQSRVGAKLSLLSFTDIHSYSRQLSAIVDFRDGHLTQIDDTIHLGDAVGEYYEDDFSFWSNKGADTFLNVIGNHDVWKTNGDTATGIEAYNKFFSPYITRWGVIQPNGAESNGLCYYHKDYNNAIRLIVLDDSHLNTSQLSWFVSTLSDARTNGLHVVVAKHYAPYGLELMPCPFTSKIAFSGNQINTDYVDAVESFINDGGNFACWLVGHTHRDYIATIEEHPNQLCIAIETSACRNDNMDSIRVEGTKSENAFELISINPTNYTLNIVRIGSDCDMYLRRKELLCLSYKSPQIVV